MAGAGELVRRARESRGAANAARARAGARIEPTRAEFARRREEVRQPTEAQPSEARPDAGSRREFQPHHGSYSALMRSHDRMRTQHLPVQGGGDRA